MDYWRHNFIVIFIFLLIFETLGSKPVSFLVPPKLTVQNRNAGRYKFETRFLVPPKKTVQNKWDQDFERRYSFAPSSLRRSESIAEEKQEVEELEEIEEVDDAQNVDIENEDTDEQQTEEEQTEEEQADEEEEDQEEEEEEDKPEKGDPLWRTYLIPANFSDLLSIFNLWLDVVLFYGAEISIVNQLGKEGNVKVYRRFSRKNPWVKFFTRYKGSRNVND